MHSKSRNWKKLDIIVYANNQVSRPGNALFSYDPPRIYSVLPPVLVDFCVGKGSLASCNPRGPFLILGTNFGVSQNDVQSIVFGGAPCLNWIHISHRPLCAYVLARAKRIKWVQRCKVERSSKWWAVL